MTAARRVSLQPHTETADMVAELTRKHDHRELYTRDAGGRRNRTRSRYHVIQLPPLLVQLVARPSSAGEDHGSAGFESRPAARIDALDTLIRIDTEATAWLRILGQPTGGTLVQILRRVWSTALGLPADQVRTRRLVEADIRRWWSSARVVTGWEKPAWRPANTCPLCGEFGSLRVRWDQEVGLCVECTQTWDPTSIGLLADHIRAENDATRPDAGRVPACWCPLPQPQPRTLRLCPACGSARCHRALQPLSSATPDTPQGTPGD